MRRIFFPSTVMLMFAMITFGLIASQTFAQSSSRGLSTSANSVMNGPVQTISDQVVPQVYDTAPTQVYSQQPVYTYQEAPQYQTYQPAAAPAPAAKPAGPGPDTKAYKGVYYANDFSYLTPDYDGPRFFGDNWKNLDVGNTGKLSIGGEFRYRYMSEQGMGQQAGATRFQDTQNDFGLVRLRLFADYKVNDRVRLYAEGIYSDVADSNDEYIPRGIDRNRGDFQNLFADVKITENTNVRIGRQELLLGSQRVISPLDWANTRRTFQGVRGTSKFNDWTVDAFWTQPVPVLFDEIDRGNESADFYGGYMTYNGWDRSNLDLYYLGFNNDANGGTFNRDTFGTRMYGNRGADGQWLYDFEGYVQTGNQQVLDQNIEAYAVTAGIGRKFDRPWKPTLWFYYDYASGNNPNDTDTFQRNEDLFPLGHKYLGFVDAVQRENVASPNVLLTANPTKKLKLLLWYYNFQSARENDIVPALGGTSAQSLEETDLGNEIDFLASLNINSRTNLLIGYSHFFAGDKLLDNTDADFFYLQATKRF